MRDSQRGPAKRFRAVSDLRIQCQCEYKFLLRQKIGENSSNANRRGTLLHNYESVDNDYEFKTNNSWWLIVLVISLLAAVLWMVG
ncbi:MAG: hypothetical protein ACXAEB_06030 [Candidatus Thorarchaeota archaeon]|jgi:hypothetical protein